jgi:outer membrane lipoprotein-sorting protein
MSEGNAMLKKMVMVGLSLLFLCANSFAAEKGELDIIGKVDNILSTRTIKSQQLMTVYRKDGSVRPYRMDVMTDGKDKAFAEILEPPREKGRQMLRLGDIVWSYLPSVKKSIRVSGRGSFMGGDFENNDVLRVDLVGDYTARVIEESTDQYVLELKGKDLSLAYAKMKLWVRKSDFQPTKQEYFTITDKLIKRTIYEDVRDFKGHKRPGKLIMQSALHPKEKTVLELVTFEKGVKNPARIFRRSNLGK